MSNKKSISYSSTGVNYEVMDPFKIMAQNEGLKTAANLKDTKFKEISESRGESAYVIEGPNEYFAIVEECLGTKVLIADEMEKITGKSYYQQIAQDSVAYIVNDLITVGARPLTVAAYWSVGDSKWFENKKRVKNLIKGWARACDLTGASWGGGETPTLSGIVQKEAIDIAGASVGIVTPKSRLILGQNLKAGDAIVLLESKGIQSNGVSLARKITSHLHKGYGTKMKDGKMYGEALLVPTIIYSKLIQDLFKGGVDIHYIANITGHGWRKIMRSTKKLTYRINKMPPIPEIFNFIMDKGPVELKEAYGTFNMGAGFAIFVSKKDAEKIVQISKKNKLKAYIAGVVEEGLKQVIIEPLNITFESESLGVR